MLSLPPELLGCIFGWLERHHHVFLTRVCVAWRRTLTTSATNILVPIYHYNYSLDYLNQVVELKPTLTSDDLRAFVKADRRWRTGKALILFRSLQFVPTPEFFADRVAARDTETILICMERNFYWGHSYWSERDGRYLRAIRENYCRRFYQRTLASRG